MADHTFADKIDAQGERDRWKKELPAVPSAYTPSGKLPGKALGFMGAGALLGVPAGILAGVALAAAGALLMFVIVLLIEAISESCNVVFCLPVLVLVILPFITFFGMYIGAGMASSEVVVAMGRIGKNRNTGAAMLISLISSVTASAAFWFISLEASQSIISGSKSDAMQREVLSTVYTMGTFGWICMIAGCVIAGIAALVHAHNRIHTAKFCEDCELYMDRQELNSMSFDRSKEIVGHLERGDIAESAAVLASSSGSDATPLLFACPTCNSGYVEVTVKFTGKWVVTKKDGTTSQESLTDSWLAGSRSLRPGEVALLRGNAKKEKAASG
jgi:hypothetical protein